MQDEQLGRRDQLVTTHTPVVHAVVGALAARVPASVDRAELTGVGLVALVRAAESYDPDRGVPFAAYVRTTVGAALVEHLRSYDWAGRSTRPLVGDDADRPSPERVSLVADAVAELPERLQLVVRGFFLEQRPMAEIAAALGVSEARVSQLRAEALVLLRSAFAVAFAAQERAAGRGASPRAPYLESA